MGFVDRLTPQSPGRDLKLPIPSATYVVELEMAQQAQVRNPFMLMINPEVVFAAIENSERLSGLNRHLCRPLVRQSLPASGEVAEIAIRVDEDDELCDD